MSSMISSRRAFVSEASEAKVGSSGWAVFALIAGLALMAAGLGFNVTAVFAAGSIAFVCSFLYLNSMFWAKWMDKTDYKPTSFRNYHL